MGRKKVEQEKRRTHNIACFLTKKEYNEVVEMAQNAGMSIAAYIRNVILNTKKINNE